MYDLIYVYLDVLLIPQTALAHRQAYVGTAAGGMPFRPHFSIGFIDSATTHPQNSVGLEADD